MEDLRNRAVRVMMIIYGKTYGIYCCDVGMTAILHRQIWRVPPGLWYKYIGTRLGPNICIWYQTRCPCLHEVYILQSVAGQVALLTASCVLPATEFLKGNRVGVSSCMLCSWCIARASSSSPCIANTFWWSFEMQEFSEKPAIENQRPYRCEHYQQMPINFRLIWKQLAEPCTLIWETFALGQVCFKWTPNATCWLGAVGIYWCWMGSAQIFDQAPHVLQLLWMSPVRVILEHL